MSSVVTITILNFDFLTNLLKFENIFCKSYLFMIIWMKNILNQWNFDSINTTYVFNNTI